MRGRDHSERMIYGRTGLLLLAMTLGTVGCSPMSYKITPVPTDRQLKERILIRGKGLAPPKIALIDVDGVMVNAETGTFLQEGEHPVSLLLEKLHKAERDRRVKGIVLRINSPGGTVTASDLMYQEILEFRARTGKPVVAVVMDVAASGGYYVACACDEIVAHRTSVTGSIGVLMQMFNVAGTMKKIGVSADAIKSGPNKDAGSPFRGMTPDERDLFQAMVDEFYDAFLDVVAVGRPDLPLDRVRALADGRVYTAQQALDLGLIDRIGTVTDAAKSCLQRAAIQTASLVTYHRPLAWKPNIYARGPEPGAIRRDRLVLTLPDRLTNPTPRFMYLWAPGY